MKIASWRPAISGQPGPCGSGWVMSALKAPLPRNTAQNCYDPKTPPL
jgi:hypothetical protein